MAFTTPFPHPIDHRERKRGETDWHYPLFHGQLSVKGCVNFTCPFPCPRIFCSSPRKNRQDKIEIIIWHACRWLHVAGVLGRRVAAARLTIKVMDRNQLRAEEGRGGERLGRAWFVGHSRASLARHVLAFALPQHLSISLGSSLIKNPVFAVN